MKITIFGSGYVGLVTGACFAEVGNDVLCVDVDPLKVAMLQRGVESRGQAGTGGWGWEAVAQMTSSGAFNMCW